jgi:hypothetical protein
MRLSTLAAAAAAGLFVYAFATPQGRKTRRRLFDDRLGSVAWLRAHRPGLAGDLTEIERRIDALGDELKARLDELPHVAQPRPDADDWRMDEGDVRHDLPGLRPR